MRTQLIRRRLALAVGLALGLSAPAFAQGSYPTKPIRMIVPLAAGSAVDVAARLLAQKMSQSMGQAIVIENNVTEHVLGQAKVVDKALAFDELMGG